MVKVSGCNMVAFKAEWPLERTVLANRSCGHVPQRKLRQTLGSVKCRFAVGVPMAIGKER